MELIVEVVNINYGHNKKLLEACPPLKDYSFFVSRVRYYLKRGMTLEQAVDAALDDMSNDAVIKPALLANQAEVKRMCLLEYDEEKTLRGRYEKGKSVGLKKGRKEGIVIGEARGRAEERAKNFEAFGGLVADGLVSIKEAAKRTGVSVAEFRRLTGL